MRRIVLFNVKFSPNLGDGLLSECLERELARSLPGCDITSIDLAGRRTYPAAHGRARGAALSLLDRCPPILRRRVAAAMLHLLLALRLRDHYRAGLADAQAVVVGGGNLLTDADLNFPMKISGALAEATRRTLPVAVYAVGVSSDWSHAANRLFAHALATANLVSATVRDERSRASWCAQLSDRGIAAPHVVLDPGILASRHYAPGHRDPTRRLVGFGVTDPLAVRYHAAHAASAPLESWYPQALRSLVEHGFEVALFTNGSPEDREYLQARFHDWIRFAKGPVTMAASFDTPADLAAFVSGCDAIVGHRMHACIAAYSFAVPAIGLRWDVKLDSFFELAGRADHMLDPATVPASELGLRTAAAIADRFDPKPLIACARNQIAAFAAQLQQA